MTMSKLSGFLELLKAPLKILSQNGKLMAITATVYLILYSISFFLYMLSANPFILDLMFKLMALASARPGTPDFTKLLVAIREDTGIFLGIEVAYMVSKTWTRPFVTSLWVQLLALGYTSFFLLPFLVPSLVLFDHRTILITILIFLAIFFITFYIYLSVVWGLAIVVSVVEDSYGYSSLGKAKELVNGKRVHGFLLNLFFILVLVVIAIIGSKLSPAMPIVGGVIQILLMGTISMFQSMAYTGFYFQCKNDMTKSGGLEYSRIPAAPVLDQYIP
ncbi:hypothetical protein HanIR_Chr03g0103671 [Helianthus annuus]|nr:hypothetical protein HanIR_Chr03g0103671 [Helianthus annuus]